MRYLYQLVLVFLAVFFAWIVQTGAWTGIIAQSGDILNISKWNEMANQVIIALTQSGNTFGTKVILGSNDNQPLGIETNNTERITVLSGWNVGIGTTNPLEKLELNSTVANTSWFKLTQLTNTSPISSGAVITLWVTSTGIVVPVPNGFPTILRTTVAQPNTSNVTYQNVNVLQIPVVVGKTYVFRAYLIYNAATAATGIRLRMTAPNNFWYTATVNNTATTSQYRSLYNNGVISLLSTASIATTGNVAVVEGTLIPTIAGTCIIQFASETNGNAITIQPDSILQYYTY